MIDREESPAELLTERRAKNRDNSHIARIAEFKREASNPYPVSKWREVLALSVSQMQCQDIQASGPTCWNELTITNQDSTRFVPRAVRELFESDGRPIIDLDLIAPLPEPPTVIGYDHDCNYFISRWGTHYQHPLLKVWKTNDWRHQEYHFNTRLFPIDKAAESLSREFPYIVVELKFHVAIAGISGHMEFRNGKAVVNRLNEGFSAEGWELKYDKKGVAERDVNPWGYYSLEKPGEVVSRWVKSNNIEYHEKTALESMRLPQVDHFLRKTKDYRSKQAREAKETTTVALGARILINPIIDLDGIDQRALEYCLTQDTSNYDACKNLPSREVANEAERRDLDVHIVNYIKHMHSRYDDIWPPFRTVGGVMESHIIKTRTLYMIAHQYPDLSDAVWLLLSGYKVHQWIED